MVANDAMELARMCARAADDAKAENVRVYDLRGMSSLTDFMVVCTGLSVPPSASRHPGAGRSRPGKGGSPPHLCGRYACGIVVRSGLH